MLFGVIFSSFDIFFACLMTFIVIGPSYGGALEERSSLELLGCNGAIEALKNENELLKA